MAISISLSAFKIDAGRESITSFQTLNPLGMAESFWSFQDPNLYLAYMAKEKCELRDVKAGISVIFMR